MPTRVARRRGIVGFILLALAPLAGAVAQSAIARPVRYMEYRADAITGDGETLHGGAGLTVPIGYYVRVGFIGAAGATWRDDATRPSARTDVIARFSLDPFREVPVGLSLGGGVSVRYEEGRRVRPYLTAVIDVEGRRRGAFTPAVQIGLGGGARIGFVLRRSASRWR
jgi:hypothetical protein